MEILLFTVIKGQRWGGCVMLKGKQYSDKIFIILDVGVHIFYPIEDIVGTNERFLLPKWNQEGP